MEQRHKTPNPHLKAREKERERDCPTDLLLVVPRAFFFGRVRVKISHGNFPKIRDPKIDTRVLQSLLSRRKSLHWFLKRLGLDVMKPLGLGFRILG